MTTRVATRISPRLGCSLLGVALLLAATSCKKEEPPAPPPPPPPAPVVPVEIKPEEPAPAPTPEPTATSTAKAGPAADSTGLKKCCSALRQNAQSAPPDQAPAYLMAAGACEGLVNSSQGRQALGTIRAMLKGASLPASCQ
jgi:hypothetical protein